MWLLNIAPDSGSSIGGDDSCSNVLSGMSLSSPDRVRLYSPVSPDGNSEDPSALSDLLVTPDGRAAATPQSFVSASPYPLSMGSFNNTIDSSHSDFGVQLILNQVSALLLCYPRNVQSDVMVCTHACVL